MNILCLSFIAVAVSAISQWERVAGGPTSLAGERLVQARPAKSDLSRLCCIGITLSIKRKDSRQFDQRIDEQAIMSDECKIL